MKTITTVTTLSPPGKQMHRFNDQSYVTIGGSKDENGEIIHHFKGQITGESNSSLQFFLFYSYTG